MKKARQEKKRIVKEEKREIGTGGIEKLLLRFKASKSHWVAVRLASLYIEGGAYSSGLKWAKISLGIEPSCPLGHWEAANAFSLLNRHAEAIGHWSAITRRGKTLISHSCSEGGQWVASLVRDAHYRLAFDLAQIGQVQVARYHLMRYRNHEGRSIYKQSTVKRLDERIRGRAN